MAELTLRHILVMGEREITLKMKSGLRVRPPTQPAELPVGPVRHVPVWRVRPFPNYDRKFMKGNQLAWVMNPRTASAASVNCANEAFALDSVLSC